MVSLEMVQHECKWSRLVGFVFSERTAVFVSPHPHPPHTYIKSYPLLFPPGAAQAEFGAEDD